MKSPRMKKPEVRAALAAGTEVAVDTGYKGKDWKPGAAKRALVVAVDHDRRVHTNSRYDWHGHITSDGVLVEYPDTFNGVESTRETVSPTDLLMPWADYVKLAESKAAAALRERERLADLKARAERAADTLGGRVEETYRSRLAHDFTVVGYRVVLDVDQAEAAADKQTEAAKTIRGLADQQAMPDDWYEPTLQKLEGGA